MSALLASAVAALVLTGCATPAADPAQAMSILEPANNAVVGTTFKVRFGVKGMAVAPAGEIVKDSGHNHKNSPRHWPKSRSLTLGVWLLFSIVFFLLCHRCFYYIIEIFMVSICNYSNFYIICQCVCDISKIQSPILIK